MAILVEGNASNNAPEIDTKEWGNIPVNEAPVKEASPVVSEAVVDSTVPEINPAEWIDNSTESKQVEVTSNVPYAVDTYFNLAPEKAEKINNLSKKFDMPFSGILENEEVYNKVAEQEKIGQTVLEKNAEGNFKYPVTAEFFSNPITAALGRKDPQNLVTIEDHARNMKEFEERNDPWYKVASKQLLSATASFVSGTISGSTDLAYKTLLLPANVASSMGASPEITKGLAEIMFPSGLGEDSRPIYDPKTNTLTSPKGLLKNELLDRIDSVAEYFAPVEAQKEWLALAESGQIKEAVGVLAVKAIASVPNMVVAAKTLAMGVGGWALGGAVMGAPAASGALKKDEGGDKSVIGQTLNAANAALWEGLSEMIGAGWVIKRAFPAGSPLLIEAKNAFTSSILDAAKFTGKEVGKGVVTASGEGFSEFINQLAQDMGDYITGNPEGLTGTLRRSIENAGVGFAMGGGVHTIGSAVQVKQQIDKAKSAREQFSKLEKAVKESPHSPEILEQQVTAINKDAGISDKVYLPSEALDTLYQTKSVEEANAVVEALGITREQITEARETKSEIEVDKAKYVVQSAKSELVGSMFKNDVRLSVDDLSTIEQREAPKAMREAMAEVRKELEKDKTDNEATQLSAFRDTMLRKKEEGGLGYTAEQANHQLVIAQELFKNFIKRDGETLQQAFDRVNPQLKVEGLPKEIQVLEDEKAPLAKELKSLSKDKSETAIARKEVIKNRIAEIDGKIKQFKVEKAPNIYTQTNLENAKGQVQLSPIGETGTAIITLFKNSSDMSTFVHELMHIAVRELENRVDSLNIDDKISKMYDSLDKYTDGGLSSADATVREKAHEKIAQAFEKYLSEGKAPNIALKDTFAAFRNWILNIYRSLKQTLTDITPEVREVFDGMLASEDAIKDSKMFYEGLRSIESALKVPESPEMEKKKKDAKEAAIEKQISAFWKAYSKGQAGLAETRKWAEAKVSERPFYKMLDEVIKDGGIDIPSLKELISKKDLEEIRRKFPELTSRNANEDRTALKVAGEYGYSSIETFIDDLLTSGSKGEEVNKLMAARKAEVIAQARAVFSNDVYTEGDEAFHNDKQIIVLMAEAQILADKLYEKELYEERKEAKRADRVALELLKEQAKDMVGKEKFSKAIDYKKYSRAEGKAAEKALLLTEQGEIVEAYKYKKAQILNHMAVIESIKARDLGKKIENDYKANKLSKLLARVEAQYRNYVADLIQTYGLSTSTKITPKAKVVDLKSLDSDLAALIPEWVQNRETRGAETWKDLSVEDLTELNKAINTLTTYGKEELSVLKDVDLNTKEKFVNEIISSLSELKDNPKPETYVNSPMGLIKNPWRKIKGGMTSFVAKSTQMLYIAERMDNFMFTKKGELGPVRRLVSKAITAEAKLQEIMKNTMNLVDPHFKVLAEARSNIEKEYGKAFTLEGLPVAQDLMQDGQTRWTPEMLLAFSLNMGNAGNYNSLKSSFNYTDKQMQKIADMMEPYAEAIQGIWDATESLFPELDATHFRLTNSYLEKVEAVPLIMGKKQLKGGYYPIQFDYAVSAKAQDLNLSMDDLHKIGMEDRTNGVLRSVKPNDRFTNKRQGNSILPKLSLDVWLSHVSDVARYTAFSEYLSEAKGILLSPEVKSLVKTKLGDEYNNSIRDWISNMANPNSQRKTGFDMFLDSMRRKSSVFILGMNLTTGIKQRLQLLNVASEIGMKWLIEGYKQTDIKNATLGLESSDVWQNLLLKSEYLKARQGKIDREMMDVLNNVSWKSKRFTIAGKSFTTNDVNDFMFEWLAMNDRAIIAPSWLGAYSKYLHDNMSKKDMTEEEMEKDAIRKADALIQSTQPSSLSSDMSSLFNSNGLIRLFTSFMTGTSKYGNRFVHQAEALKAGAITQKQYFRHLIYETVGYGLLDATLSSMLYAGSPPEWKDLVYSPFETMISWIPVVRDLLPIIRKKFGKKTIGNVPAFKGLDLVANTLADMSEGDWDKFAWGAGLTVDYFTGIPATRVAKDLMHDYSVIKGDFQK